MEKEIVIIGRGSEARVVFDILIELGLEKSVIGFIDPISDAIPEKSNFYQGKSILATRGNYIDFLRGNKWLNLVIALGDNKVRAEIYGKLCSENLSLYTVIHPKAVVSRSAKVSPGVIVHAGAVVGVDTTIDISTIINTSASIDHDDVIGKFVHIAPGAHLAGNVKVGDCSFIGIGASIIQGVTIGRNTTVGAGAVVIDDLPDNVVAVGVPAKIIKRQ